EFRARFFVMTATLPTLLRQSISDAISEHTVIEASAETYREFHRHRIVPVDGDLLDRLALVADCANRGLSVLVCCNTVQRAQDAWEELTERLPDTEVVLLHGRFTGRDRLAKEDVVREATGAKSERRRPIVLVATQVVEVSLDIDLDTIFTDPAPLEALLQRFGRINRRRRQSDLAPVHVFREPTDGQGIYDADLVRAALAIIDGAANEPLDEAGVGGWLDQVYTGDVRARWEEKFRRSLKDGERILQGLHPFHSDESLAEQFEAAFDSVEVLPSTLHSEYHRLNEVDPVLASALLVPISERSWRRLAKEGLLDARSRPHVVNLPYTSELGLDLSKARGTSE
ncbi:MAG TPA: CRISPR-associated helicase Cas3', partial [Chloroflexota bacterium]|nr:CRISPR-associated helicase Cas3' [Chloroflexota bacterium]